MNKPLDLKTAARQIKASCEIKRERKERPPFFFITGAGLSAPSVPLAAEIVQHCKTRATELYGITAPPPSASALDSYSHWLAHAYPNAEERRHYLQSMIERKAITPGNLRLAHLLLNQTPSHLVITTNFDDLLSRALFLFGKQHVLCDHPSTIGRIQPEREQDIQIVHVHGSYWFYDCCNLKDEIAARAQRSAALPFDMAAFLDHVLHNRSPLVLGYSGWEGDVVMSALRRRLYHNDQPNALGYNVYWFVYDRTHIASLPEWLRDHANVVFVAKPEPAPEPAKSAGERMAALRSTGFEKEQRDLVLPAHEAFDELIRAFDLPTPELLHNPLNFFITSLRHSLPQDEPTNAQPDIYLMRSMLERLVRAQQNLTETLNDLDTQMETVRDALRRAQYGEALACGAKISLENLFEEQRRELMRLLWDAARGLNDNSVEELGGYVQIEAVCALLPALTEEEQIMLARALFRKGYVLSELNRSEEALAAYDEVLRRFGEATELPLRERVARALVNKGHRLGNLDRGDEELAVYGEVLRRFGEATEMSLCEQVARALVNKGYRLVSLNRNEEALAAYDKVLRCFGEASELPLREQVAKALVNKSIILGVLNRSEEELAVYDQALNRFGEATDEPLREQVARALVNKGNRLVSLNRNEEAVVVYNEVLRRFGEDAELPLHERAAKALMNKGITLGNLKRNEEALVAYDEVLRRFGEATELPLREHVVRALFNKGHRLGDLNRNEEVLVVYQEVINRFGEATELSLREQVARALVNKGVKLSELNRSEEAVAVYDEVLRRFGDATELPLREQVAKALLNKGYRLGGLKRNEEAFAAYDEVLRRFGEARELSLREQVAKVLINKGSKLSKLNHNEEAFAIYDEVLRRFGEATELPLREQVAVALVNKGNRLCRLNRSEEKLAVYEEVLRRFGKATELPLRKRVAAALNSIGFHLLCEAKYAWVSGKESEVQQLLVTAQEKITASLARRPNNAITLGNHGYIKFLLGEKEQARELLTKAIALGGEEVRKTELEDSNLHPLPQDEEFRGLVQSIPLPTAQAAAKTSEAGLAPKAS